MCALGIQPKQSAAHLCGEERIAEEIAISHSDQEAPVWVQLLLFLQVSRNCPDLLPHFPRADDRFSYFFDFPAFEDFVDEVLFQEAGALPATDDAFAVNPFQLN